MDKKKEQVELLIDKITEQLDLLSDLSKIKTQERDKLKELGDGFSATAIDNQLKGGSSVYYKIYNLICDFKREHDIDQD